MSSPETNELASACMNAGRVAVYCAEKNISEQDTDTPAGALPAATSLTIPPNVERSSENVCSALMAICLLSYWMHEGVLLRIPHWVAPPCMHLQSRPLPRGEL